MMGARRSWSLFPRWGGNPKFPGLATLGAKRDAEILPSLKLRDGLAAAESRACEIGEQNGRPLVARASELSHRMPREEPSGLELDEGELFNDDVAGGVERPARTGLYTIAGDDSEPSESEGADEDVGALEELDDVHPLHTPPNLELRGDWRFASSWAAGAAAMEISRGNVRAQLSASAVPGLAGRSPTVSFLCGRTETGGPVSSATARRILSQKSLLSLCRRGARELGTGPFCHHYTRHSVACSLPHLCVAADVCRDPSHVVLQNLDV